ncbi:ferric reductase [Fusarium subglutinans]|uniref:Ferric reductase n=1 Tax=Gibberella subglutinans TaxID=42677 RepID=A0A8H5L9Z3_GIBSU|nr:ferric reductase [Fusarium subglutinans]KAF5589109.1 ferric reductase [Fusarium subglutinans]
MDFTRRRIADISSYIPTSTLKSRGEAAPADAEATPNYHSNLDGVNQPMNLLFKDALWWTLGIMALVVLSIRIIEILWMRLRQVSAMNVSGSKQAYWRISQWSWMPNVKKNLIYAPLWNKRHNREFKLSSAISMGTLPSRLHFIILFIYLGSNLAYMFVLNWHNENKLAFCAELRGRSGTLALVNMVPLIIFAGRNNLLIGLLKISFDTYNLLHRWMGRIVVLESIIHTIAWLIVAVDDLGWDGVGHKLSHGLFEGSGAVGTVAMTFLLLLSVSPLRHAFYETFLSVHIVLAFVAFVATWIHCASSALKGGLPQLPWIMAIMAIWFADRLARMLRIVFVNWSSKGWTDAVCEAMPGNVTRVTLHLPRYVDIKPGTHAYLRFWGLCAWESHPFSICWVNHVRDNSLPIAEKDPLHAVDKSTMTTTVSFLIGAQTGFTKKLFDRASRCPRGLRIKAAMEGPYAGHNSLDSYGHAVLFAGSTGITHQISYIRHLLEGYNQGTTAARRITLVWIIREYESLEWVRPYMDTILRIPNRKDILRIQIFVTRPQNPRDIVSASATVRMFPGRPNVPLILAREVQEQMGAMCVTVCGPGALADDVRGAARAVQGSTVVDFVLITIPGPFIDEAQAKPGTFEFHPIKIQLSDPKSKDGSRSASGAKRKRTDTRNGEPASHRRRTVEPTAGSEDEEEDEDVYDPDQPLEERRRVQQGFRDLLRDVTENTEEYLQGDSRGLHEAILRADELSKKVRQTTEATIDSRLLVSTTDLSYRKTLRLTQGSLSQGIDVDEFVSKCITYMRHGRGIMDDNAPELSSTQRQRRRTTRGDEDGEDDIGDEGDMMNWPHLGRFASLPYIRRPALPGFLLGPLSVEKKARKITKRSAPFRPNNLTETRPEVLNVEDLAKKENDLTAICGKILHQLQALQANIQGTVADLIDENMDEEEQNRIMHQYGLRSTGGIDLMRFVVNPKSFGQTIENMFYVSFLVRDGRVKIDFDEFDLPALEIIERDVEGEEEEPTRHGAAKHQAILSMDMETWQDIIDTFDLKEPMIAHRKEVTTSGPGARGWYS